MPTSSATPVGAPGALPHSPTEVWEMRIPGTIYLKVLKANRFNQPIEDTLVLGPNRRGMRFEITTDDRQDNQRLIADPAHDPFTNGMLLRIDADQQGSDETRSPDALSDEQLLEILDLKDEPFQTRVAGLGEVAVRSIREIAEAAGASHSKVIWLDEHIAERYQPGGAQRSVEDESFSERLS